jgi:hypothetical protein
MTLTKKRIGRKRSNKTKKGGYDWRPKNKKDRARGTRKTNKTNKTNK